MLGGFCGGVGGFCMPVVIMAGGFSLLLQVEHKAWAGYWPLIWVEGDKRFRQ